MKNLRAFLQDKKMHVIYNFINALGQLIPRLVQKTCPEKKQVFIKFFGQMSYAFFLRNTSSQKSKSVSTYRKVSSSNTSFLEAHASFFRLLMNDIFDPNIL